MGSSKDSSMTTTHPYPYLTYAPTSPLTHRSNKQFFDMLGFKSAETSEDIRKAFLTDMTNHVQFTSHKYLTKAENEDAFKTVVSEFLAEHGPTYWGDSERHHLKEADTRKGFLCPRDALTTRSRFFGVVGDLFSYRANNARTIDAQRPKAKRLNRSIDFNALTGRKADLIQPISATGSSNRASRRPRTRQVLSDSEGPTRPAQTPHNDQTPTGSKTVFTVPLPIRQAAFPMPFPTRQAVFSGPAEILEQAKNSKRARPSHSSQKTEVYRPLHASHSQNVTPSLNFLPETDRSDLDIVTLSGDSDTSEKHQRKKVRKSLPDNVNINTGPDSPAQAQATRVKFEPLSPDITSRIDLCVMADGLGVSTYGPVIVDFEQYKTAERLFTSLISKRQLKWEKQKSVKALTATVYGKKRCCYRNGEDDWAQVCRQIRKLWDSSPKLFDDRFEVDIMLHVDESVELARCV